MKNKYLKGKARHICLENNHLAKLIFSNVYLFFYADEFLLVQLILNILQYPGMKLLSRNVRGSFLHHCSRKSILQSSNRQQTLTN